VNEASDPVVSCPRVTAVRVCAEMVRGPGATSTVCTGNVLTLVLIVDRDDDV